MGRSGNMSAYYSGYKKALLKEKKYFLGLNIAGVVV